MYTIATANWTEVWAIPVNVRIPPGHVDRHPVGVALGAVRKQELSVHGKRCDHCAPAGRLQNAMTSSEERTSAEAEGYRIEGALLDCVAPLISRGDAIHQCPRADSWLLSGGFSTSLERWALLKPEERRGPRAACTEPGFDRPPRTRVAAWLLRSRPWQVVVDPVDNLGVKRSRVLLVARLQPCRQKTGVPVRVVIMPYRMPVQVVAELPVVVRASERPVKPAIRVAWHLAHLVGKGVNIAEHRRIGLAANPRGPAPRRRRPQPRSRLCICVVECQLPAVGVVDGMVWWG